jgi:hypothetical protein
VYGNSWVSIELLPYSACDSVVHHCKYLDTAPHRSHPILFEVPVVTNMGQTVPRYQYILQACVGQQKLPTYPGML